jgi:hypothetical protein
MSLELQEDPSGLRTIMHQINPREFTEIINITDIIFKPPNILGCRTPDIRKISSNGAIERCKEAVYDN